MKKYIDVIKKMYKEGLEKEWYRKTDNTSAWQIYPFIFKEKYEDQVDLNDEDMIESEIIHDRLTEPIRSRFENVINSFDFLDDITIKDYTLLDLACECGVYSMISTQKFKKVIGIDNNKIACKRALITKEIFAKEGYDISNLEVKHISFQDYVKNTKFDMNYKQLYATGEYHSMSTKEYVKNSIFYNDKIDAILACEIFAMFSDEDIELLAEVLNDVKLVMIQSKYKEKNQWEWDKSFYATQPVTYEDGKSNSYHLYARDEIIKFLKNNNFNKIIVYPKDSNNGVVIGKK